jgi:hypothetical protein
LSTTGTPPPAANAPTASSPEVTTTRAHAALPALLRGIQNGAKPPMSRRSKDESEWQLIFVVNALPTVRSTKPSKRHP